MSENLPLRAQIAAELLGSALSADGFAACPGRTHHTGSNGPRDFRVILSGAPTGFCFHAHCADAVETFNKELRQRIARAESGGRMEPPFRPLGADVAPAPEAPRLAKRPPFDPAKLAGYAARCPHAVSLAWLRARSPEPVPEPEAQNRATALAFLAALYADGERVLVFTRQTSQGDFLWHGGTETSGLGESPRLMSCQKRKHGDAETFRLGESPVAEPVASPLPVGGPEGVWFLAQPVSGEWCANPYAARTGGPARSGRRHGGCVTAWRYLVLESDEAEPELWLRALVMLPLPLVAIYTSGGRSVHALARVDARTKAEWDALRDDLLPVLCPLGADPGAMTAVRLSRLPGMLRHGSRGKDGKPLRYPRPRLQELAWLNPAAPARPILEIVSPNA